MELREIVGFSGYFAGDDGAVYSMRPRCGNARPPENPRRLRTTQNPQSGYLQVVMMLNRKTKTRKVHPLVCSAFHGAKPKGMEVCHGVRGKQDNCPSNLSWGTHSKNMSEDKRRDGTICRNKRSLVGANVKKQNNQTEV